MELGLLGQVKVSGAIDKGMFGGTELMTVCRKAEDTVMHHQMSPERRQVDFPAKMPPGTPSPQHLSTPVSICHFFHLSSLDTGGRDGKEMHGP